MNKPKIYLAGPDVFLVNSIEMGEQFKLICEKYGLLGVYPLDSAFGPSRPGHEHELGITIFRSNIHLMESADACIANMTPFRGPSMDVGTAFEIGYMVSRKKPVFGYSQDSRFYSEKAQEWNGSPLRRDIEDRFRDRLGDSVEEFGMIDNLMVVGGVTEMKTSRALFTPASSMPSKP